MVRSRRRRLGRLAQQHTTGCGIACIAMLARKNYAAALKKAEEILPDDFGYRRNFRTTASCLRQLAATYGFTVGRKVRFRDVRRMKLRNFECYMIKRRSSCHAIVAVNPNTDRTRWHWVLWDYERRRILDPKDPPYKMITPFYDLKITL